MSEQTITRPRRGFISTLLWKNTLILRKSPGKILFAVFFPVAVVLFLNYCKTQSTTSETPDGWSTSVGSHNLFSHDYYVTESTLSALLLNLAVDGWTQRQNASNTSAIHSCSRAAFAGNVSTNPSSPYAWPEECRAFIVPQKLAIVPDNTFTRSYFARFLAELYPRVPLTSDGSLVVPSWEDSLLFFNDNAALDRYATGPNYGINFTFPQVAAAIVFSATPPVLGAPGNMEYSIRMNKGDIESTLNQDVNPLQRSITTGAYTKYATSGFMTLQTLVTRFALCMPNPSSTSACTLTPRVASSPAIDTQLFDQVLQDRTLDAVANKYRRYVGKSFDPQDDIPAASMPHLLRPLYHVPHAIGGGAVFPFPISAFTSSSFYDIVSQLLGLMVLFGYMQMLAAVVVGLVGEKESRSRELMKILGVSDVAIVSSWLVTFGFMALLSAGLCTVAATYGLFVASSPLVVFVFFLLVGLSVICLGYGISTIFSKARLATQVGTFIYFVSYSLTTALTMPGSSTTNKFVACLSPSGAMNLGVSLLASAEASGVGISLDNVADSIDNFSFLGVLAMLALDSVLFILLGGYLEKVVPKDFGVVEKWYFPVSPSYWRRFFHLGRPSALGVSFENEPLLAAAVDDNDAVESVSMELKRQEESGDALQIRQLRKVFSVPGGEKVAVHGLNLTMYKNQITCLLGHNGAGKTTLISMLTGMIGASAGDATVRGLSLNNDLDAIRASLGMCPQHDILYPELTVQEHLIFYGKIKGFAGDLLAREVDKKMDEVGLTEKRHARSTELSGGMKRKLALAIAFLGDSSIVFLDEPTSGMDPYSRRSSWEVIMNNRHNRIVVLTTHFMDEADILGDRIAIMAEGELRCCGSSLFLKNRYGAGYNLSMVKAANCDTAALTAFVTQHIGTRAKVLSSVGTEISFQLPLDCSHLFADMFTSLDDQLDAFGVVSYGISVTTMEEVFIKVAEIGDVGHQHTLKTESMAKKAAPLTPSSTFKLSLSNQPTNLFATQWSALLKKRLRVARRDKRLVLFGILAPVLLIYFGIRSLNPQTLVVSDPALTLSTAGYPLADQTPVAAMCESDWLCNVADHLSGAHGYNISAPVPVYPTTSPTVFNLTYHNVDTSGANGFSLRLGDEVWQRGYGVHGPATRGQYGGFVFMGSKKSGLFGYSLAVNSTSTHGAIVHKAMADEAIYRVVSGRPDVRLTVVHEPLPMANKDTRGLSLAAAIMAAIFVVMAFAQYSAAIVPGLVHEKHPGHNSKHQQLVSGVSLTAFWLANLACDLVLFVIPCVIGLLLIWISDVSQLTGRDCTACAPHTFPAVVAIFVLFGCAMVPFCYLLSYCFTEPSTSQSISVLVNMVIGFALVIASLIMDQLPQTQELNKTLKYIWRLSPLFNLGNGLFTLSMQSIYNMIPFFTPADAFSSNVMGTELVFLAVESVVFFVATIAVDYALSFPRIKSALSRDPQVPIEPHPHEDEDVVAEAARVLRGGAANDAVVMQQLRKVYPGKTVGVENLSLGLHRGECFGYLGINGAGKTTTMKMLTGDVVPTSGRGTLGGFDILSQQLDVRRLIGYCPQFDALIDLLTVREHLELFASIKGVPPSHLDAVVAEKMSQLNLEDFEHKLANSLSGGTKRKLSVAIAMIGAPPIIFLDEPSTGMDPVSRRFMWDVISDVSTKSKESTILLTTHSMEECEALCTRVGIMVDGRLRCLGSIQHLKHKFGDGLMMHVKLTSVASEAVQAMLDQHFATETTLTAARVDEVCAAMGRPDRAALVNMDHPTGYILAESLAQSQYIRAADFCMWWLGENHFDALHGHLHDAFGASSVLLLERQNDVARFKLRGEKLLLGTVFSDIERMKAVLSIQEYTVSQTTLEQIFNAFASQQKGSKGQ
ncbi:Aste57867_22967 [Aphanomyces stellatus]|uniref:Aste57867_22967 protein n=1 Tax=Aphanomyces stellatus TaxID=120398 RepID=A0A485LLF7_9STRA|nr:hypothetical protein As57867_022896 [Aphanomyces stellatus]VFT99617.1 Aste57867_22967 [Aphanomyces stellatus]